MLSRRGNDLFACWAYGETISPHAKYTGKRFHRTLSILGNDFIACWAYAERISSHAEHARKRFHRTLSIRRTKRKWQCTVLRRCRKLNENFWFFMSCKSGLISVIRFANKFKGQYCHPRITYALPLRAPSSPYACIGAARPIRWEFYFLYW